MVRGQMAQNAQCASGAIQTNAGTSKLEVVLLHIWYVVILMYI